MPSATPGSMVEEGSKVTVVVKDASIIARLVKARHALALFGGLVMSRAVGN